MTDDTGKNPWNTLSTQVKYDNPWISVRHNEVLNPAGNKGIYGVVHFKNLAVGIVPLDEELNTWLVGQHRYPIDAYSWEIPEGGGSLTENPLLDAKRELLEETGITAAHWSKVLEAHLSNSVSNERAIVFVAQSLSFGASNPEESEELKLRKVQFSEALRMVHEGEITDALAMLAILKVETMLRDGSLNRNVPA